MKTEEIALSRVSENEANPRTITEANFQKLVKSILVFPKMLQLRPIVVDETYKALGGNMRTRALCHIVSMTPEAIMDVLDPHYCDVIIARWEKLTGEKAVKIDEFKKQVE